mgnify:CR=1 FL=1
MELGGRTLTVDVGRVAAQANGAAFMHYGDTTVLSTATASDKPRDGVDFFPLSVEFEEKMYSVGKIPGGFNKREGKASENSVLTARVIDRPMRPLFPKDYRNDVSLNNLVMSVDPECRPELVAMLGSAISTCISDIPFDGPCAMTQVGLIDGEFIINPTSAQKKVSDLALTVASTREKVIMIEAGANEVPEDTMIEAIYKAHDVNQEIIRFIDKIVAECGKEKHLYASCAVPEELFEAIKKIVPSEEMEEAVFTDDKQTREENIREITARLQEAFADNEEWLAVLGEAVYQYQKKTVRKMILKDHKRPDGRAITQIRPLAAEVDIIPRVHGSAMFTRGQTQICNICTLAPLSEVQKLDGLDEMVCKVETRSPEVVRAYREKLEQKVHDLLEDSQIDDNRIAAEVVLFSDKICNDEETVRLHSHIQGMKKMLEEKEGIGRKLDFMAQEMNREANTILSKSSDLIISNIAIDLKTEIEKIREQVQNVE